LKAVCDFSFKIRKRTYGSVPETAIPYRHAVRISSHTTERVPRREISAVREYLDTQHAYDVWIAPVEQTK
jgi:hypothetical protein